MENISMDPYEAQLLAVFTNFADSAGTLNDSSLTELCTALQMEAERADELLSIAKRPGQRVTFSRFRDSLLKVLGAGGDAALVATTTVVRQSDDDSSGRELSPKFVYGSKKYGRRSRPHEHTINTHRLTEKETLLHDTDVDSSSSVDCCRQAPVMAENPATLAADNAIYTCQDIEKAKQESNNIELDHNRVVDCDEAMELCRSMRMGNIDSDLIRELYEDHDLSSDGRMTVGTFFHLLNKKLITSITVDNKDVSTSSGENIRKGEAKWQRMSWVERNLVVEMWERAGISHCRQMLHDLGFTAERVNLPDLMASLDEEIKSLLGHIDKSSGMSVPSLLLQASLSLHRYELRCVRESMEQVFAENTKMKTDLSEANQRAQMLVQEVDDNHIKMETSLRNKVKQLEMKQAEVVKTMVEECAREREAVNVEVGQLRDKLSAMETEETKLRALCSTLERANDELERRLTQGDELTRELEQVRTHLTREVRSLRAERDNCDPARQHHSEIEKLAALVSDFRLENKSLRDRNDELCVEIEDLQEKLTRENRRLSLGRSKPQCSVDITSEQAMSLLEECDAWGGGPEGGWDLRRDGANAIKRRGDSPSKGQYALFEDESPRIGKLRRRHIGKDGDEPVKPDANTEWELDSCSDGGSLPPTFTGKEIIGNMPDRNTTCGCETKIIVDNIRQTLIKFNHDKNTNCESCNILKDILSMIHRQIDSADVTRTDVCVETINKTSTETVATQTELDSVITEKEKCEKEMLKYKDENVKLVNMCRHLEVSLEQLKSEYDKCEDYWARKLDEEREIFSDEQRISDEKFQDLLSKISEYEEQFAPAQKGGSKLATIDEKYSLELQFTELEEEFDLYRKEKTLEVEEKIKEINILRDQVKHLQQVKSSSLSEDHGASSNIDETDNLITQATSPIGYLWNQGTIQSPLFKQDGQKRESARDYQNPAFAKQSDHNQNPDVNIRSLSDNEKEPPVQNPIKKPSAPRRSSSADLLNHQSVGNWCESAGPESAETMREGGGMIQCAELEGQLRKNVHTPQSGSSAWSTEGGWQRDAEAACLLLEQRCRQLHLALRQHQICLDTVRHNAQSESNILRQRLYSAEAAIDKLQQRLTSADLLVKELYVENCQLSAFKPQLL